MIRPDFEKLFTQVRAEQPPAELYGRIIGRIRREERRRNLLQRIVPGCVGIAASMPLAVVAFQAITDQLAGNAAVFSLVFSDTDMVLQFGRDFLATMAEALPINGMITLLAACFLGLLSGAALAQGIGSLRDDRDFTPTLTL